MRESCLLSLLVVCLSFATASGESFPYEVVVSAPEAPLRSGPGKQYYATGSAPRGEAFEVFRRKASGWLAIRPPQASFSWVAAKQLRETSDPEIAKVVGNGVVAWIGSDVDDVEDHKWQIKLDPGEPVKVLGQRVVSMFQGDRPREYYRIAPPAGEFRWIDERDVKSKSRPRTVEKPRSEVELADFQVVADDTTGEPEPARYGFVARPSSESERGDRVASLAPRPEFKPRLRSPAGVAEALEQLTIELSLMAAKSPGEQRFAKLLRQAETVAEQSSTTLQRAKARRLIEEIEAFEALQDETARTSEPETEELRERRATADASADTNDTDSFNPRFDGRGWLLPVHSTKRAAPPYAILNNDGRILNYVSPAPGLNLHRYLRKQVGIFGQRSRATFLNKPHLTAERIVDLARHRR